MLKNISSNKIRSLWLEYFKKQNHLIIPPASLIPKNDNTLLWINSGVATLKPYFDGSKTPPSPRMANSQISIRTNDIDNVGITARHHTLFEMLGNFSIGDYFKEKAIILAWDFLTSKEWLAINPEKLYITVFKKDLEAIKIWKKIIKIDESHLILGDQKTNFWEIGAGPCGPNTEIFFDRGIKYDPKNIGIKLLKNDIENDRYLEVWNLVFSEYNSDGKGNYEPLPQKNIDTGAGLERLASLLQDVPTSYDTDQFMKIIKEIENYTSHKYDINNFFKKDIKQQKINTSFKVIADHIKCCTLAISDGAQPSNEKRGYILRRLIRRALNYARKLDIKKPILHKLVVVIVEYNKHFLPKLKTNCQKIIQIIKIEEEKFQKTIDKGIEKFGEILQKNKTFISGEKAWLLYNSFGFPIELTTELAKDNNANVDMDGFYKIKEFHQRKAKKTFKSTTLMKLQKKTFLEIKEKTEFLENKENIEARISKIIKNNEFVNNGKGEITLVLDKTIFFVATGGQVSDEGTINGDQVTKVIKNASGTVFHKINTTNNYKINDIVVLKIWNKRKEIKAHHSGTHLLHKAIRDVLGTDSQQMGSYVGPDKLRFDFNCNSKPTPEQLHNIQEKVRNNIKINDITKIEYIPYNIAIKKGVLAIFTEIYDYNQKQRTIKIGDSYELCGGTHVKNTLEIEDFLITNVQSKGSNLYRIEALCTNDLILEWNNSKNEDLKNILTNFQNLHNKHEYFFDFKIEQTKSYENNYAKFLTYKKDLINKSKIYNKKINKINFQKYFSQEEQIQDIGKHKLLVIKSSDELPVGIDVVNYFCNKTNNLIALWLTSINQKHEIVIRLSKDIHSQLSAKNLLSEILSTTKGRGGGNNVMARGLVENKNLFDNAIKKMIEKLNG